MKGRKREREKDNECHKQERINNTDNTTEGNNTQNNEEKKDQGRVPF